MEQYTFSEFLVSSIDKFQWILKSPAILVDSEAFKSLCFGQNILPYSLLSGLGFHGVKSYNAKKSAFPAILGHRFTAW